MDMDNPVMWGAVLAIVALAFIGLRRVRRNRQVRARQRLIRAIDYAADKAACLEQLRYQLTRSSATTVYNIDGEPYTIRQLIDEVERLTPVGRRMISHCSDPEYWEGIFRSRSARAANA